MPKVTVLANRTVHFRTLGPVVDAALRTPDIDVDIALPTVQSLGDQKAHQRPTLDTLPPRLAGRCRAKVFESHDHLRDHLAGSDAVVAIFGRSVLPPEATNGLRRTVWCAVFDADHSVIPEHGFKDADVTCWPSSYYVDWAIENGLDRREHVERRARVVGYVRADCLELSTREATKREWRLDVGRPVVLFVPDGYRLRMDPAFVTDWYRHVWCVEHRSERFARAVLLRKVSVREALQQPVEADVLRALALFCRRQDAQLVMMPRRRKDRAGSRILTRSEQQICDHLVAEDIHYPQTMLRAIQMADLVVCGYRSATLMDALAAGVPYVTIGLPTKAESAENLAYARRFDREQGHHPGATWLFSADQFAGTFAQRSFDDFRTDPDVLAGMRRRYVGPVDGRCAERVIDQIRAALDHTRAGERRVAAPVVS